MAKIEKPTVFYGMCGEGLGHFSRAAFLVPELLEKGYRVELFSSGNVANLCEKRFGGCRVHRVPGFRMHYHANALDMIRTTLNYAAMMRGPFASFPVARRVRKTRPAAVISDYEPVVAWIANLFRIPLITLDHQQIATECETGNASQKTLAEILLRRSNRMVYLKPSLRIITSFFKAPLRQRGESAERRIIGPVLRPEVVSRKPSSGSHVVVYQTTRTFEWLNRILDSLPGEKHIYGTGQKQSGHPERPFSEDLFLDDLASCRFAVVNGGHTTISEALYYNKPVLCFPVRRQFEQELNARNVAKLGFGMDYRPAQGEIPDFTEFFEREDEIRQAISRAENKCGNDELREIVLHRLGKWSATG